MARADATVIRKMPWVSAAVRAQPMLMAMEFAITWIPARMTQQTSKTLAVCAAVREVDVDEDGICDDEDNCTGYHSLQLQGDALAGGYNEPCETPMARAIATEIASQMLMETGFVMWTKSPVVPTPRNAIMTRKSLKTIQHLVWSRTSVEFAVEMACLQARAIADTYPATGYDCDGDCLNDADGDGVCDEFEVLGCTDATACNYDANATENDPSACMTRDVTNVCGGTCTTDVDGDGICDHDTNGRRHRRGFVHHRNGCGGCVWCVWWKRYPSWRLRLLRQRSWTLWVCAVVVVFWMRTAMVFAM